MDSQCEHTNARIESARLNSPLPPVLRMFAQPATRMIGRLSSVLEGAGGHAGNARHFCQIASRRSGFSDRLIRRALSHCECTTLTIVSDPSSVKLTSTRVGSSIAPGYHVKLIRYGRSQSIKSPSLAFSPVAERSKKRPPANVYKCRLESSKRRWPGGHQKPIRDVKIRNACAIEQRTRTMRHKGSVTVPVRSCVFGS